MPTTPAPSYSGVIDQNFFIERLSGPAHPRSYLERFPEEVYNKSPDSHLVKFMYALLGPAGVGWLKKNLLDARLALESRGLELTNMEKFYGDPFRFGRILEELYDVDPSGLLTRAEWSELKARDEAYRTRAVEYFNAVRLGTSPPGMTLTARSGLGHNVEIIEHYRYLFDIHTDDPLGLPNLGSTLSTNEFVILPRQNVSRSEIQQIQFDTPFTSGNFTVSFNGATTIPLGTSATAFELQAALETLPNIGTGNVHVTGDLSTGFEVKFTGKLSNQDVSTLKINSLLVDESGPSPVMRVAGVIPTSGLDASTDKVSLAPSSLHAMQVALDHLRPVNSLPTLADAYGISAQQRWSDAFATSEYSEILRFVTGSGTIQWPPVSSVYWIERGIEKEAPRVHGDLQQHYVGFHNVESVRAYTDAALDDPDYETTNGVLASYVSQKAGAFSPQQISAVPALASYSDPTAVYAGDKVLSDHPEPLTVTTQDDSTGATFVNGMYPTDYSLLPGIPSLKYKTERFWSSLERPGGADFLEIDLGSVQAVNFITFECIQVPLRIELAFDVLDQGGSRRFINVTPLNKLAFPDATYYDANQQNPWASLSFLFSDALGHIPITRYIRLKFTRFLDPDPSQRFLYNEATGYQNPFSVEVRNLRIGRNVIV